MSQRIVERVIGQFAPNEEPRVEFARASRDTPESLRVRGRELDHTEVDPLTSTDIDMWSEIAGRIDPRLQRCGLNGTDETSGNV